MVMDIVTDMATTTLMPLHHQHLALFMRHYTHTHMRVLTHIRIRTLIRHLQPRTRTSIFLALRSRTTTTTIHTLLQITLTASPSTPTPTPNMLTPTLIRTLMMHTHS